MQYGQIIPAGGSMNNEQIINHTSHITFKVETNISYDEERQIDLLDKKASQLIDFFNLSDVKVNIDVRGTSLKSFLSNATLEDIVLCSQAMELPVVINRNSSNTITLDITLALTANGYVPLTQRNSLTLSVQNNTLHSITVHAYSTNANLSNGLAQIQKNTLIRNQYTPVKNSNYLFLIVPVAQRVEIFYNNGVSNIIDQTEADIINDQNGRIGAVANNVLLSNFGLSFIIPMIAVNEVRIHGIDEDNQVYYAIKNESL
jgi:hypothetical protein